MFSVLSGRALGGQRWLAFTDHRAGASRNVGGGRAASGRTLAIAEYARRSRTRRVMSFDRYALWVGRQIHMPRPGDTGRDPADSLVEERRRHLCPRNARPRAQDHAIEV
jgi:hypothetical protein